MDQSFDKNLVTSARAPVYRSVRYKQIWERFSLWCAESELSLSLGNELLWLDSLKDQGMSASTIKLYGYAVKAYLIDNVAEAYESPDEVNFAKYQIDLEFRGYKMPKVEKSKHKEKLITDEELKDILGSSRIKTRILIEFLASTGCRVSEMVGVRHKHIRKIKDSEYRIRIMGKGSKERTVKINGGLRKRIHKAFPGTAEYLFESSPGVGYTRQNIHDLIQRAGERIGIKGLHPHSMRHYFATRLIDKTGDIEAVSQYLGHSDVSTTLAMYYHGSPLSMEQLSLDLYGDRGKKKRSQVNAT